MVSFFEESLLSAIILKSPALEIQIYDKALESNNRQSYTRIEIRLKIYATRTFIA